MRIATYNAASIRARLLNVLDWIAVNEPDVLAIQETKVEDEKFPISDFEDLGYHVALNGQKSWNGVALISRSPILDVRRGFEDQSMPEDARFLSAEIDGIRFLNTYVPNGNRVGTDKFEYKLQWLDKFNSYIRERFHPSMPLVWLGDMNIAPTPDDVYDSPKFFGGVGHHPDEFDRLNRILEFPLTDVFRKFHEGPGFYTYWDFYIIPAAKRNLGWRIDHIYATAPLAEKCVECVIDRDARMVDKPSDHTYVTATFDL